MSEVIDLIAAAIAEIEAERYPLKVFAWFDHTTEKWRGAKRNRKFKHPTYCKAWPMDWDILPTARYQFALHDPCLPLILAGYPKSAA